MPRPQPSASQWQPGQSGNPKGRPIGSRNKLNEKFILALHDDFAKYGPTVIAEVREKRPEVYLKVIASILPRELHFKSANAFDGMSDEELSTLLVDVRRSLTARAGEGSPAGTRSQEREVHARSAALQARRPQWRSTPYRVECAEVSLRFRSTLT